jgi:murein DD-endopeptidase MepM/ murein hydrolase activator NlpD
MHVAPAAMIIAAATILVSCVTPIHRGLSSSESTTADFILPFNAETEVVCTHSSGVGSHSYTNAFYALDFASDYSQAAPEVLAAADGKAFVFLGENGTLCAQPTGTPSSAKADKCGNGWGNNIKILHSSGYVSFYVHLERPLIKNGELVKKGQPIGIMGWTGLAGHRHLHFSVQKIPGDTQAEREKHISWDGQSVPFEFMARQNGKILTFNAKDIRCAHAEIGNAPAEMQPRFQGLQQ